MLGKILENLIHDRKISKTKLSAHLGIYRTTLDDYINEKTFMPSNLVEKTAAYFGVSISFLFGESSESGKYVDESLRQQVTELTKQIKQLNKTLK